MSFTKVILTGTKDKIKTAFQRFNTLIDDLLATTAGKGASQIGIQDTALNMAAANVEDALAEIYTDVGTIISLGELFNVNSETTTGLTWGYKGGKIRADNVINDIPDGTVSLTDNATNYIEVSGAGAVSRNSVGFTSGLIPIRLITTSAGVQTSSVDKRSFFSTTTSLADVLHGGTGRTTLTNHGILVGAGTAAITMLAEATNGQLPIGSTGTDPILATITGTANQITITDAAGSITISIPNTASITFGNTGLRILDTNASHGLTIKPGSDLTLDKTLTITTGDADRIITLAGDLTTAGAVSVSTYGATLVDDADGTTALSTLGVSAFAKTILDDADAAATRTTLGLGNAATKNTGLSAGQVILFDYFTDQSKLANGWQVLPGGLTLQWGIVACNFTGSATNTSVTFPMAFPNAALNAQLCYAGATIVASSLNYGIYSINTTGLVIQTYSNGTFTSNVYWFVIGH